MPSFALDPSAVVWTVADDEVVAIDNRTAEYLTLNDSAACLWAMLAEGATQEQMVERLLTEYEPVTMEQAEADVRGFVGLLQARNFLLST